MIAMTKDLFGGEPKAAGKRSYAARGYARPPGSGPSGETCKTCEHCTATSGGNWKGYKCAVIKHRWNHSPATDIALRSLACERWQQLGGGVTRDER